MQLFVCPSAVEDFCLLISFFDVYAASPDGSENPFERKPIFCGFCRTTNGSSCKSQQKKVCEQKIVANSGK